MPRVGDLGDCPLCFGRLLPLSVCQSCDSVVVRETLGEVGPTLPCEDCGATNPTHFVCSACNARFPYGEIVKHEGPTCPVCKNPVPSGAQLCPHCSAVLPVAEVVGAHPRRRIRGEFGEEDIHEVGRIPGVGRQKAEALCAAGYNALWKISGASRDDLAKVRGVGAKAADQIKESLKFLLLVGRRKTKEEVLSEEYECPLCGTITSLFATRCHDCGAMLDEEELDEDFRKEVEREEDKGLLAYYDVRLLENPEGAALHYARGALLLGMGRPPDALAAFDRVLQLNPANRRAMQAKARALAAAKGLGGATQVLRDVVSSVERAGKPSPPVKEEEVARAMEALGALVDEAECPECGEKQVAGAILCPACGHRFGPPPEPVPEGPQAPAPVREAERTISMDEERLLEELERAVAGEKGAPPPPLRPEVPPEVVDKKRAMLAFLLNVSGVSRRAAEAVSGFFQDLIQIRRSDLADLSDIPGVAPAEARLIMEAVEREFGPEEEPAPEPVPARVEPELEPPVRPVARPPVPTPRPTPEVAVAPRPSELAAGRRGLINGRGLVNGRGRVNGLINGTGFVNGSSLAEMRLPRKSFLPRYVAIGAALIMLFAIAAALVGTPQVRYAITIDGSVGDWQGIPVYPGATPSGNPDAGIASVSMTSANSVLFLRLAVTGLAFADPVDYDTMYAFLDTDGNASNGYDLGDLGADFLVRVSGTGGRVHDSRLLAFDEASGRSRMDWSAWVATRGIDASSRGAQVEVAIPTDLLEDGKPYDEPQLRVRFTFDDNDGEASHTLVPIGIVPGGGALLVRQVDLAANLAASGSQALLRLTFEAIGGPVSVDAVSVLTNAGATSGVPSQVLLAGGATQSFDVSVDPSNLVAGDVAFARVVGVLADRPSAIVGPDARAYVVAAPAGKRVDGLFDDWVGAIPDPDASVRRPSLNITARDGSVVGSDLFLYARLEGIALEGVQAPARVIRAPPGGPGGGNPGPAPPPPPVVGLDYLRFFVDSNATDLAGVSVEGILADRFVEVRGRGGRVTGSGAFLWSGTDWVPEAVVQTGVGENEIEASVRLPAASFAGTEVVVVASDWAGTADVADARGTRTRGDPGLDPLDGTNFQTAIAKPLVNGDPTVDGNCGTSGTEYQGSDVYSNANVRFLLGRRPSAYVFVCLEVTSDTSDNAADWGELLFDQEHEDSSTPQANDRRFRETRGGTFTQEKGDGSGWVSCGGSCDAGNTAAAAFNNSKETYEFKIAFSDVWGSSTPDPNERAGFAVMAHNEGTADYTWGSDNVNESNPSTWGRLEVPEYPWIVGLAVVGLPVLLRRRRGCAGRP